MSTEQVSDVVSSTDEAGDQKQEQTFTQADVDRIVKDRLARQAKDVDQIRADAAAKPTLEQRIADLEGKLTVAEAKGIRTSIAAEFGISTKAGENGSPSDADLFLTGTDEATLRAQAERLAGRKADTQGHAPNEGDVKNNGDVAKDLREFSRSLFASAKTD